MTARTLAPLLLATSLAHAAPARPAQADDDETPSTADRPLGEIERRDLARDGRTLRTIGLAVLGFGAFSVPALVLGIYTLAGDDWDWGLIILAPSVTSLAAHLIIGGVLYAAGNEHLARANRVGLAIAPLCGGAAASLSLDF